MAEQEAGRGDTIPHVDEEALGLLPERVILLGFRGSVVHGTYRPPTNPNSVDDIDLMAVHVGPLEHYLGFRRKGQETLDRSSGPWDVVSYEVRHYFALLRKNNPNVQQLLWTPDRYIVQTTDLGERLRKHRRMFLSKQAYDAFNGYAYSQFKKLEKKDHRGYMGQKRKKLVERHGYDTKYASHLIRLIRMGCEYLRHGEVVLPRPDADDLLAIKDGDWTLQEVRGAAQDGFDALREAKEDSPLPETTDQQAIESLLIQTVAEYHDLATPTPRPTMSRASSVEEIRERLEAATPGERWEYDRTGNRLTVVSFQGDNYEHIAEMCGYHDATAVRADAELIAHAPTDLRYLLERVEGLEGALEGLPELLYEAAHAIEDPSSYAQSPAWCPPRLRETAEAIEAEGESDGSDD